MRGTYFGAQTLTNIGHFIGPWLGGFLFVSYGGNTLYVLDGCSYQLRDPFSIGEARIVKYGEKYVEKSKFLMNLQN